MKAKSGYYEFWLVSESEIAFCGFESWIFDPPLFSVFDIELVSLDF